MKYISRSVAGGVSKALKKKIVLLSGPRQSGKTTFSKNLRKRSEYLNYDIIEDRSFFKDRSWDRKNELIIFDELHKMPKWKSWLKSIYDGEGVPPEILVTGSAKLDSYTKVGDSLAGRFFQFRLLPFDIKEVVRNYALKKMKMKSDECFDRMMRYGGFPEPFLEATDSFYGQWKRSHHDIILKQDLIDLEKITEISVIETLVQALRERVGSSTSYSSLARDLQKGSDKTVKKWLRALESLYLVFAVSPYSKNVTRSVKKQPKYYFYDIAQTLDPEAARLENLVALSLLKEVFFQNDVYGKNYELFYLKKKGQAEIDFLVCEARKPKLMIEVKWRDDSPSPNFKLYQDDLPGCAKVQLVADLQREKTYPDGLEIRRAHQWLSSFSLD